MSEYEIRAGRAGEELQLRPLWRECFGDIEESMICYETNIFRPEWVEVAVWKGQVVSMLSMIPSTVHTGRGESLYSGYLYSLATLPEHQDKGLGARLLEAGMERWGAEGMVCFSGIPDVPSLFGYYKRTMKADPAFYVREAQVEAVPAAVPLTPQAASVADYCAARRHQLQGRTHIEWIEQAVQFQRAACHQEGGDMFLFQEAPDCCAAVERGEAGELLVRELLAPEELLLSCLAGLMTHMGCTRAEVRLPAWSGTQLGGRVEPFGVLTGSILTEADQGYMGFDFV